MSTHDIKGKEWARVDQVFEGSIVTTDGGMSCCLPNREYAVYASESKELFIQCDDGDHMLNGQHNEECSHYVGMYLMES